MANKRVSKKITGELRDQLLALDEKDITSSFIYDLFGEYKGKSKCNPYDILEIPPNSYGPDGHKNKNSFTTTVGIWIFNKWFIEKDLFDIFGYINITINKKQLKNMNQDFSYLLI